MNNDQNSVKPWPIFTLAAFLTPLVGVLIGGWIGFGFGAGDLPSPEVMAMAGGLIGGVISLVPAFSFGVMAYLRREIRFR